MKKLVPIPPESLNRLKEDDLKDFGYLSLPKIRSHCKSATSTR